MVDHMVAGIAAFLWLVAIAKGLGLYRARTVAGGWLWGTLVLVAAGATLSVTEVSIAVDSVGRVASLSEPVARSCILGAASCAQALLRESSEGRSPNRLRTSRRRVLVLVSALAVLWAAFIAGSTEGGFTYGSYADPALWPVLFMATFLAYFAFALTDIAVTCLRYARSADGPLAVGLRLIGVGSLVCLGYVTVKAAAIVMAAAGPPMPHSFEATVGRLTAVLAGVLVAVGVSWLGVMRRWSTIWKWAESYRAYRDLYPLWSALMSVAPGLALEPPAGVFRDWFRVRDMDIRLYRRVIEIRDGLLHLRPYLDAVVAEIAGEEAQGLGFSREESAAFVEANVVAHALRSAREDAMSSRPWQDDAFAGASVAEEVHWLRRVAHQHLPEEGSLTPKRRWSDHAVTRRHHRGLA